jgi:hypothetical protein
MMGEETSEICWATHKCQIINLWKYCILLVELLESYDDARTCERQNYDLINTLGLYLHERFLNKTCMPNKTFPNNRRKTSYTRPCSECVCRPEDAEEKIVTLSLIYIHTTCLRCGNLPFYKIFSLRWGKENTLTEPRMYTKIQIINNLVSCLLKWHAWPMDSGIPSSDLVFRRPVFLHNFGDRLLKHVCQYKFTFP